MTARRAAIAFPSLGATSCVGALSADGVTGLGPGEKSGGGGGGTYSPGRPRPRGGGGGGGTTPRGGTTARDVGAAARGAAAGRGLTSLTYAGFRRSQDQTASSSAAPHAPAASGTRSRRRQCPRPVILMPSAISTRAPTSSVARSAQTPRTSDLPNCTHDIQ